MGKKLHIRKPKEGEHKPKRKRKVSISTIIMSLILIIGLGVMAYPTFSDWWNSFHQAKVIQEYVEAVQDTDPKQIAKMLEDAHAYNERLANDPARFVMTDAERNEYNSLLNLTGNGVMGYVNIPSIGVNLPVYHGVDEIHLQVAVGHIESSSLPVGGPSTHCAVSAHRGLPSAKLFSDLDRVKEGDIFTFTVLDQTITYEVDQIRIVEPSDLSDLALQEGVDYATLITCTPYGVNSHRMLVRGHRIENLSNQAVVPAGAVQIPAYIAVPAVGIPLLFVYLVFALIYHRRKRPELDTKEALETVRKHAMGEQTEEEGAESGTDKDTKGKE